jgi:hypothetical protein
MTSLIEFKPLPAPWHFFEVSADGHVRRRSTGVILKASINNCGYLQVGVAAYDPIQYPDPWTTRPRDRLRRGNTVHRLVALAWLPPPQGLAREIDHIDRDKTNNHYSNLRWVTRRENNHNRPQNLTRARGLILRTNLATQEVEVMGAHEFPEYNRVLQRMRAENSRDIRHRGYRYQHIQGQQKKTYLRQREDK